MSEYLLSLSMGVHELHYEWLTPRPKEFDDLYYDHDTSFSDRYPDGVDIWVRSDQRNLIDGCFDGSLNRRRGAWIVSEKFRNIVKSYNPRNVEFIPSRIHFGNQPCKSAENHPMYFMNVFECIDVIDFDRSDASVPEVHYKGSVYRYLENFNHLKFRVKHLDLHLFYVKYIRRKMFVSPDLAGALSGVGFSNLEITKFPLQTGINPQTKRPFIFDEGSHYYGES